MNVTVSIPDSLVPRVIAAVCWRYGYQEQIPDGLGGFQDNPETPAQFTKRVLFKEFPKELMRQYEGELARQQAGVQVTADTGGIDAQ